jgi:PAS domain-containing protein
VQKWRIQTHPVESQKYSNDLIIRFGQDVTNEVNSHKRYKTLVESATDIIYEIDQDGNYIFINQNSIKILGYNLTELSTKNLLI